MIQSIIVSIFIAFFSIHSDEWVKPFGTGLKQDPYDLVSSIKEANPDSSKLTNLPTQVDLSSKMPPIENQGTQESSVAWAVAYIVKSYTESLKESDDKNVYFSPSFVYNSLNGGKNEGISIVEALDFMMKQGAVSMESMPYNVSNFKLKPSDKLIKEASKYKINEFVKVRFNEIEQIKYQLSIGNPVVIGILVNKKFFKLKGDDIYKSSKKEFVGGHAVAVVGYDDSKKAFKFANSWGKEWGENGYGYIDYSWFSKACRVAYIVIDQATTVVERSPTIPKNKMATADYTVNPPEKIYATSGNYSNKVIVSWTAVDNAIGYEVHRANPGTAKFRRIGLTTDVEYTDKVEPELAFTYKVKSVSLNSISDLSNESATGFAKGDSKHTLPPVTGLSATDAMYKDKIVLEWNYIEDAKEYQIVKWKSDIKQFVNVSKVKGTFYEDKSVSENGVAEIYKVAAISTKSEVGEFSTSIMGRTADNRPAIPSNVRASKGQYKDKIAIQWEKVKKATEYDIYRFSDNKWGRIATVNSESYEDDNPPTGNIYYSISAKSKSGKVSDFSEHTIGYIIDSKNRTGNMMDPPSNVYASFNKSNMEVNVSWEKVKGADSYTIWQRGQGESEWKNIANISSKTFYKFGLPETNKFFAYSISSNSANNEVSDFSKLASVVFAEPVSFPVQRAFGGDSKLEKFKGTWTAMDWDGQSGVKNIILEIESSEDNNEFTIKVDNNKTYQGKYVQGSPVIDIDGKLKIKLATNENALMVELQDKAITNKKTELSFMKE